MTHIVERLRISKGLQAMSEAASINLADCNCGPEFRIYDSDAGHVVCRRCGLVIHEDSESETGREQFSTRGHGMTLPHIADKNLTTTFNVYDISKGNALKQAEFRRLFHLNRTAPIRKGSATIMKLARQLRPTLEQLHLSEELIDRALSYATTLVIKQGIPKERYVYEALAVLALMQTDQRRAQIHGAEGLALMIAGGPAKGVDYNTKLRVEQFRERDGRFQETWSGQLQLPSELPRRIAIVANLRFESRKEATITLPLSITLASPSRSRCSIECAHRRDDDGTELLLRAPKGTYAPNSKVNIFLIVATKPKNKVITADAGLDTTYLQKSIINVYNRLCTHYRIHPTPLTANQIITDDPTLKPVLKEQALRNLELVHSLYQKNITLQRLTPQLEAALAVLETTGKGLNRIAQQYNVTEAMLRSRHEELRLELQA
jgi:hypothetical protein